ncbi:hypothetical protein EAE99_005076 [Botrytis elliptica]|nr:hypothetical protein EAE99_005076 [Botrytis elliptica]
MRIWGREIHTLRCGSREILEQYLIPCCSLCWVVWGAKIGGVWNFGWVGFGVGWVWYFDRIHGYLHFYPYLSLELGAAPSLYV